MEITIIAEQFGAHLSGRKFALRDLAIKPNTDVLRDAPSRALISELLERGATIAAYDPVAMGQARSLYRDEPNIRFSARSFGACDDANALVIVTEWKEFRSPDFAVLKAKLKSPMTFDGRNLFDPRLPASSGIRYFPIGRDTCEESPH